MERQATGRASDDDMLNLAHEPEIPLLGRLARAWQAANPKKAAGGPLALAGFHFQLEVALLEHLETWLRLSSSERDGQETFIEELSDIVLKAADQPLVVMQVKLTQTPATLRKGLDDLLSVHEVVRAEAPGRAAEIEYGLAFRFADPKAAQSVIDRWADIDPGIRQPLASRVQIGVHPDPGGQIESLLSNTLRALEPQSIRYEWVGSLLRSAASPTVDERRAQMHVSTQQIWRKLTDLDRARKSSGAIYMVSPQDVAPEQPEPGKVLTGQQPDFRYLRQGYFAERPRAMGGIRERFIRWVENRSASAPGSTVPVFWIAGRSGSGKSVLLVQFVSKLRAEGWDQIFWLGNKSRLLPGAARWAASSFISEGPPLIAIDDPYGPGGPRHEAWDEFLAELNSVRQDDDPSAIPIVICCGPTEQAERLSREFPGELDVELVELQREPSEELEDLRAWYRARTGAEAPEAEPNVLLVQLFFQWQVGQTLVAFAHRFRSRIVDAGGGDVVLPLLEQTLALNRLYLGFPQAAADRRLPGQEADRLARLLRENHLTVGDEGARAGLWLAHPHLANGIYDAWFPPATAAGARRRHFEDAAREFMAADAGAVERLAPVEAIALGISAGDSDIRSRVDPGLIEALPNLYSGEQAPSPERLPISELALWIDVQAVSGVALQPDPVNIALPLLTRQATHLRETARLCEVMLTRFDRLSEQQRRDLLKIVTDLLEEAPEWSGWGQVARVAIEVSPTERLTELCALWLDEHIRLDAAGWVVESLLTKVSVSVEVIRPAALRLLKERPQHRGWGRVWTAIWDREATVDLRELGLSHLRAAPKDLSWAYIWTRLERKPLEGADPKTTKAILDVGMDWLRRSTQHIGWGVVWGVLWERGPSEELETQARRWLRQADPTLQPFSYVWKALWFRGRRDERLRDEGINALRRLNTNHLSWGHIFPALYKAFPEPHLRALGLRWVGSAHPDDPPWGYVLPALWNVARETGDSELLDDLESHCLRFLDNASLEHGAWGYVFVLLWKRERSDRLRERALQWLVETPVEHRGIHNMWERLWNDGRSDDALRQWACSRLQGGFEQPGWPFIWKRICLDTEVDDDHLKLGEEWLLAAPTDHPSWSYIFRTLWPRRQCAAVRTRAFIWLSEGERTHLVWDIIWRDLWASADDFGDRDELKDRGLHWIQSRGDHLHWPEVWAYLWACEETSELRTLGEKWLSDFGGDQSKRGRVADGLEAKQENTPDTQISWNDATDLLRLRLLAGKPGSLPKALAVVHVLPPSNEDCDQSAWRNLWIEVWSRYQTYRLRRTALDWLETPNPEDCYDRSHVWESLWDAGKTRRLYEIGTAHLADAPPTRNHWRRVWIRLWKFEPSATLHRLGTVWLEQNSDHPQSEAVQHHLDVGCF
jgi:hypothetical protein